MLFLDWLKEEGSENVDWSIEDFMNFKYTPVGYMPWFMLVHYSSQILGNLDCTSSESQTVDCAKTHPRLIIHLLCLSWCPISYTR